jgi:nucleoside 2-deoxyribosyltransferase
LFFKYFIYTFKFTLTNKYEKTIYPPLNLISFSLMLLFIGFNSCKRDINNDPISNLADKQKISARFFDISPYANPELLALAKDLKKQDSINNFLVKFVAKNGYPVWDKVLFKTEHQEQSQKVFSTKTQEVNSSDKGLFLVPLIDEGTNKVKSYLVAKKHGTNTYAYQLYNRENLGKTKVNDSLKNNLIQTQAVFGYFEKQINNVDDIELTNPKKTKIKDVNISFEPNSKSLRTQAIKTNVTACAFSVEISITFKDFTNGDVLVSTEITISLDCYNVGGGGGGGTGGGGTGGGTGGGETGGGNWWDYGTGFPDPYSPSYFVYPYDPYDPFNPPYYPWFPGGGGGIISNPPISALEARINELQQVFGFSDADKQYLLNYPTVVDDIELSYNNAVIDDDYKAGIRQSMEDLRTGNTLVMNPDTNPNFETNDQTVGGDDPTVDPEYQDQDPWPTINTVIPEKDFVKYNGLNCLKLAEQQIAKLGYKISPYGTVGSTYNINTSAGVDITEARKSANYIKRALSSNIPVIVGVDYQPGSPGNPDGKTDHFIVIVGMDTDAKGKYFRFFDSGTANLWEGTSPANKLYFDSVTGLIKGTTSISSRNNTVYRDPNGRISYTITHVRRSK